MRKLASMLLAIALARSVFPVPGGPYSSTPCHDSTPGDDAAGEFSYVQSATDSSAVVYEQRLFQSQYAGKLKERA